MLHLALTMLLAAPLSQGIEGRTEPPPVSKAVVPAPVSIVAQPEASNGSDGSEPSGNPVPEPTTLLLVGTGLVGIALGSRRLRRERT